MNRQRMTFAILIGRALVILMIFFATCGVLMTFAAIWVDGPNEGNYGGSAVVLFALSVLTGVIGGLILED